jgi:palmitoyltransferase
MASDSPAPLAPTDKPDAGDAKPKRTLGNFVRDAAGRAHERREKQGAQPWIVLKLAVFITAGIVAYACYVYIGRLCVPMIRRRGGALGSRGLGSECSPHVYVTCMLSGVG